MAKYILANINIYGTEAEHLAAIRDFFVNNELMQWEVVSEQLNNDDDVPNSLLLKNGACRIEIISSADDNLKTNIDYTCKTGYANGNYNSGSTYVGIKITDYMTRKQNSNRYFKILLGYNDGAFLLNMSGYSKAGGYAISTPFLLKTSLGSTDVASATIADASYMVRTFGKADIGVDNYTPVPYHDDSTTDDTLILDTELAVKEESGKYHPDTLFNCYGLGGGEIGKFYKDEDGTVLYCFSNNCCFKLGEEVEYSFEGNKIIDESQNPIYVKPS